MFLGHGRVWWSQVFNQLWGRAGPSTGHKSVSNKLCKSSPGSSWLCKAETGRVFGRQQILISSVFHASKYLKVIWVIKWGFPNAWLILSSQNITAVTGVPPKCLLLLSSELEGETSHTKAGPWSNQKLWLSVIELHNPLLAAPELSVYGKNLFYFFLILGTIL